ncbi:MAG: alpha/beta fold hydrolase [Actinomycetota bacterium]|nr:alpha/beta fold hydrolase [Actinomycetota bacterium]
MTSVVAMAAAAASFVALGSGASASTASYPVAPNIVVAAASAVPNPAGPPPGANLAGCHSSAHPYPVVLVNGTFANQEDDFGALAPTLANQGYCVYTFAYGAPAPQFVQSIGPIAQSAQTLAAYVQQVRSATGTSQVDLVGHSQGGMLAEYYAKVLNGARFVHNLIGLSPSTHGTTLGGLEVLANSIPGANAVLAAGCAACVDQENGSAALRPLDTGAIAQPGISYTIIETTNEFVVTPVGSSFIKESGVTNEYVQTSCPFDPVDHADLTYDPVVLQLVGNALDPATAQAPNCWHAFPYPA